MNGVSELNKKYNFCKINDVNINLIVDSVKKLHDYNINKKMIEIIDANNCDIRCQLQNVLINRRNYSLYSREFDEFIDKIKRESPNDIVSRLKLYFKLIIMKLKKQKVQLNLNVNVLISYTSPAGRNHYERRFNYNYDDLVVLKSNSSNYQYNQKEKNTKTKNCIYCNKMINLNSIYCSFCGKKQKEPEKNIPFVNDEKKLKISNQMVESNARFELGNYKKQENGKFKFQVFSTTLNKYGIGIIKRKCLILNDYLTIDYSIKLIDKIKLADNCISIYVSIHENNDIISYIKEIEYLTFDDFEDKIVEGYIDIPLEKINIEEISKILIYGKIDM